MSLLTDEERRELWNIVIPAIGKLFQDAFNAPALTFMQDSEVKKITKNRRNSPTATRNATVSYSFRAFFGKRISARRR